MEQPEQILCHSQAFQKDEIYFYHCIHAVWGSFTAAKLGLMRSHNPMYILIGGDNRWVEKRPSCCQLSFPFSGSDKRLYFYIRICSLLGRKLCGDDGLARAEAKLGCIASSSTSAFSTSVKDINTRHWISAFESMLVP